MSKILCFGEFLLRLSPDLEGNWIFDHSMVVYPGGAEANVASALATWGLPVQYCTALPDNYLSRQVECYFQKKGIDISKIIYQGKRIGIYYLNKDADLKHENVIYDRAYSSFSELTPHTMDWGELLAGVDWLHFSAISPGISGNLAQICKEALLAADERNITISIDLNYRNKLWQYGKKPDQVMPMLVQHCDVIMGNVWAAETMLNAPSSSELNANATKEHYFDHTMKVCRFLHEAYPRVKTIANTFRSERHNKLDYSATLFGDDRLYFSHDYQTDRVIDRVGSGDCFMAGLIYGHVKGLENQDILEFATAAAFEKLFVPGDSTNKTIQEINATIKK